MGILFLVPFIWPFAAPNPSAFLIGQVIIVIIAAGATHDQYEENFFGHLLGWGIGGMVPYGIVFAILNSVYPEVEKAPTQHREVIAQQEGILSLSHEVGVAGRFRLGYGSIDSVPFYAAYRRNPDQGLEIVYIRGRSVLYENVIPPRQPYYQQINLQVRDQRLNTPWLVRYITKVPLISSWRDVDTINRIYVPPGTVKQEFSG